MSLSAIEQLALAQIGAERDALKRRAWEIVRANPEIGEGDFRQAVELEPDPFLTNAFGIRDRMALIDAYVANCGSFEAFKGLLLAHDLCLVLAFAPELGRPVLSCAEGLAIRLQGDRILWGIEGAPDFQREEVRDPESGMVVEERLSGTLPEGFVAVRRPIDVRLEGGGFVSTPGAWEEVI